MTFNEEDRELLRSHLEGAAPDNHPESELLVAYQQGELDSSEEERLREHVSRCPECIEVLEGLEAFGDIPDIADAELAPVPQSIPRGYRALSLGLAASLVVMAFGAAWIWRQLGESRTNASDLEERIAEIEAEASTADAEAERLRAELDHLSDEAAPTPPPSSPARAVVEKNPVVAFLRPTLPSQRSHSSEQAVQVESYRDATLIAYTTRFAPDAGYGLRILDENGRRLVEADGLDKQEPLGGFSLRIPAGTLAVGNYEVELWGMDDGNEITLERYPLRVDDE